MKESNPNRGLRVLLVTLVVLVVAFGVLVRAAYRAPTPGTKLTLDRLFRLAATGQVVEARLLDEDAVVVGMYCPTGPATPARTPGATPACRGRAAEFHTSYPRSDVTTQSLIDRLGARAPVSVDPQGGKAVTKLLITFVLPLVILANLFGLIFLSRGGDSSLADIAGFGRLGRARQRKQAASTGVTFADVAGAGEAVAELTEVIDYLKQPERFEAMGAQAPKGVLLFGPPGCGKTLLARAVAGESGVPFVSVSGTEFVESLVGVGAARVRDLFAQVRALAPAICFVDEIDAVGRRREGEGVSGGEREQTLNQLLVEMDGFEVTSGIVVIGATNRPDILDPALLRPGRFDRHITLEAPDRDGREAILRLHARSRPVSPDVDFALLARRTAGFTGADLANVMNEAALLVVRQDTPGGQITAQVLSEAVQRVLHGPHRGTVMSPEERRRIATHEAGHAVVSAAVGRSEELTRVSILARGKGLGSSSAAADGDRVLLTEPDLFAQLTTAMAGKAAEEAVFGDSSTTAADDIERATALARQMVGLYGMGNGVGPVRLLETAGGYLGSQPSPVEGVSEATRAAFDAEVARLVSEAQRQAAEIVSSNRSALEAMVAALHEHEALEGPPLESLLAQVKAPRGRPQPRPTPPAGASPRR